MLSYAADEHNFQGITKVAAVVPKPALDYVFEWDYNDKVFDCKINVGIDAGLTLRSALDTLTKDVFDKLAEMECSMCFGTKRLQRLSAKRGAIT